ncbi:putative protein-serine/threonine phosphatase [Helianthus debilis subsp. tardiflorus]
MKVFKVLNSSLQLFLLQLFHWTWIVTLEILTKIMSNTSSKSRFLFCNGRSRGTTAYHQTGTIHEDMLDMAFHTASGVYENSWSEKGDVEPQYAGARIEGDVVTLEFVKKMMDDFKNQEMLHKRFYPGMKMGDTFYLFETKVMIHM